MSLVSFDGALFQLIRHQMIGMVACPTVYHRRPLLVLSCLIKPLIAPDNEDLSRPPADIDVPVKLSCLGEGYAGYLADTTMKYVAYTCFRHLNRFCHNYPKTSNHRR